MQTTTEQEQLPITWRLNPCVAAEPLLADLLSQNAERGQRAHEVLVGTTLGQLARLGPAQWRSLAGLSLLESKRVHAAFALGRLVETERLPERPSLRRAKDVHAFMCPFLRGLRRECFAALLLDVQNRLLAMHEVSRGTLTSSLVHPREVFAPAIAERAAAVVVVHNHPSGDPEPSQADREVTRRLIRAGKLLGIPLIDHVICGHAQWRSLREVMDFDDGPEIEGPEVEVVQGIGTN